MFDQEVERYLCDVLVIGSGAAGCRAAIAASEAAAQVCLITKGPLGRSGTTNLGGVVYAAALGHADPSDSVYHHMRDTVVEGRYLGDQRMAMLMAERAPRSVYDLERYGLNWYKKGGRFYQLPTPGHSRDRGVHYNQKTGQMVQRALVRELLRPSRVNVMLLEDFLVASLIRDREGPVVGVSGVNLRTGRLGQVDAGAVIIATGGCGAMCRVTDMDTGATGDGMALALRAGAELIAPEMHQFFPTAFVHPESLRGLALATSALWKYGLRLYNANGERFMERYYPREKENVPRDLLSRAIYQEIAEGRGTEHGGVYLDTSQVAGWEEVKKHRARSYVMPQRLGIDTDRVEVAPTYHFTIGGIRVNLDTSTSVPGLFACGEAAGGLHGANRIGGNALAECVVFGEIAGEVAAGWARGNGGKAPDAVSELRRSIGAWTAGPGEGVRPIKLVRSLQDLFWRRMGIVRDHQGLSSGLQELDELGELAGRVRLAATERVFNLELVDAIQLQNMLELARAFFRGALERTESRGCHFRADYPRPDNPNWLRNIVCRKKGNQIEMETVPVEFPHVAPEEVEG